MNQGLPSPTIEDVDILLMLLVPFIAGRQLIILSVEQTVAAGYFLLGSMAGSMVHFIPGFTMAPNTLLNTTTVVSTHVGGGGVREVKVCKFKVIQSKVRAWLHVADLGRVYSIKPAHFPKKRNGIF